MPICAVCKGLHNLGECPKQQQTGIDHLFKAIDPTAEPQEFQAIRVKHINKTTGLEDNFIESYYTPPKSVQRMSRDEIEDIRYNYEIEVEGVNVPAPITSFQESGLSQDIVRHLERQGLVEPTPIQMQSLPCLLSGRDVVGMAATGSGKTLCYILPMVMFLRNKPPTGPGEGPLVIILAPNRELVEQIYGEAIKLMPQVGMSFRATSDEAPVQYAPPPAPLPPPQAPVPSSNISDLARKIQLQKQQLQIKQQTVSHQQQIQQLQQQQQQELQQVHEQLAYQASQYTPEQQQEYGLAQQHEAHLAQVTAQHHAQLAQLQAEQSQQVQQLLAEHAQAQLLHQQKQQQKEAEQAKQDYTLYSKANPSGLYDYSNYNYATANSFYNQHGSSGQEYDYSQPQFNPAPVNLAPALPRKVLGVCGGVPLQIQITPLQMGVDVLVSTPGRLIDLIHKGVCKLDRVSFMVFDEADRMLAPEMELQLRNIVTQCSICARQSVLFSATFPPAVERLVRSAVLNPIYVKIGAGNQAADTITQKVMFVHSGEKRAKLLEILRETPKPPVLIFANSPASVDYLVTVLREEQFHAAGIHGEKNQPYRFRVMKAFKDGALDVLVATDLVSRGIDVSDVTLVLQYDLPDKIENYTHRIGRTGRAGKEGRAVAFLGLDCKIAEDLRRVLKQARQPIPPELSNTKQFGGEIIRGELRDYAMKKRMT